MWDENYIPFNNLKIKRLHVAFISIVMLFLTQITFSMSRKAKFNILWTNKEDFPDFYEWIEKVDNCDSSAFCKFCHKRIELSNMGKTALLSHANGKIHKRALEVKLSSNRISSFFNKTANTSTNQSTATTHGVSDM